MNRNKRDTKKVTWTYIILVVLLLSCYLIIFEGHHYNQWLATIGIFCGFVSICAIHLMWFEVTKQRRWHKLANLGILLALIIPVAIPVYFLHNWYYDKQLKEHGQIAYGRVKELFITRNSKGGSHHYALFRYYLNNKVWIQDVNNDDLHFKAQDSLKILCSSEEPEIFKIMAVLPTRP